MISTVHKSVKEYVREVLKHGPMEINVLEQELIKISALGFGVEVEHVLDSMNDELVISNKIVELKLWRENSQHYLQIKDNNSISELQKLHFVNYKGLKKYYLDCDCNSIEHTLRFSFVDEEPDLLFVELHLTHFSFFKRLKAAIKHIFGYSSIYGDFDEVTLTVDKVKELQNSLDLFLKQNKVAKC